MTAEQPSPIIETLDYDIAAAISDREPHVRVGLIKTLVEKADPKTLDTLARKITSLDPYGERQVAYEEAGRQL